MLLKNLKRYKDEFEKISSDKIQRVRDYIESNPFTVRDTKLFHKKIKDVFTTKWNYIKIILDIIPEATPRPRLGGKGIFYVKNSKKNSEFVKHIIKEDIDLYHYVTTPCSYIVDTYFPIPKYFSKVDTILAELGFISKISIPDWDNLGKTYSDMIQQWIICNDSLIIDGRVRKHYSLKPRVEILIKYANKHISSHDQNTIEHSISYKNGVESREKLKAEKD